MGKKPLSISLENIDERSEGSDSERIEESNPNEVHASLFTHTIEYEENDLSEEEIAQVEIATESYLNLDKVVETLESVENGIKAPRGSKMGAEIKETLNLLIPSIPQSSRASFYESETEFEPNSYEFGEDKLAKYIESSKSKYYSVKKSPSKKEIQESLETTYSELEKFDMIWMEENLKL